MRFATPRGLAAAVVAAALLTAANGQELSPPAGDGSAAAPEIAIQVLKTEWQRHYAMAPFSGAQTAAKPGMPTSASGAPLNAGVNFRSSRRFYSYETEFRNETGRKIQAMAWNLVFSSPTTGEVLRRFMFVAKQSIGSGKKAKVRKTSTYAPSGKINVADLQKGEEDAYNETVEIRCVWFEGGKLWRSSRYPSNDCREPAKKNSKPRS